MKQPFCAGFLLLTVGGDAVSIVAAQLEGGRAGCGFRTAASRLVAVVVGLGSPIKRPFRGMQKGIRMAKGEKGGPAISVSQQCGSRVLKLKYCNLILIRPRLSELIVGTLALALVLYNQKSATGMT